MRLNHIKKNGLRTANHEAFGKQGYLFLPGLLAPAVADFLWSYVHTKFASLLLSAGDSQVRNTPSDYGDRAFDGVLEYLRPLIEEHCGCQLLPTYSYMRLYKHGDILKRHRDRPACEITVSVNIGQVPSDPWPLYVEGNQGPYGALLSPGDGLMYRGIDFSHWREAYLGNRLVQAFLHYVDRDGPHGDQKFDGRKTLMRQKEEHDTADANQARDT